MGITGDLHHVGDVTCMNDDGSLKLIGDLVKLLLRIFEISEEEEVTHWTIIDEIMLKSLRE